MADVNSSYGTPTRLAQAAALRVRPSVSAIEKAYVRGLKEGMRRGDARRAQLLAEKNELAIQLKTAKGELKRRALPVEYGGEDGPPR